MTTVSNAITLTVPLNYWGSLTLHANWEVAWLKQTNKQTNCSILWQATLKEVVPCDLLNSSELFGPF